ncbi:stealth family protein [Streptomyces sp. NPDC021093]|uniref:stealth family protein n=1 Tax=Streptomyces sp. NPDC021093 TaxID=3365112 RepID=UPI0037B1EBF2
MKQIEDARSVEPTGQGTGGDSAAVAATGSGPAAPADPVAPAVSVAPAAAAPVAPGVVPGSTGGVNTEASPLVAVYRKVTPKRLRRAIAGRYSPEMRRGIKRAVSAATVVQSVHQVRNARLSAQHRPLIDGSGGVVLAFDGRPRIAFVEERLSPQAARRANLTAVTAALEGAGIDYFCVRGQEYGQDHGQHRGQGRSGAPEPRGTTVAVAVRDRARALDALQELCRTVPGYFGAHGEDGRRTVPAYRPAGWKRYAGAKSLHLFWYRTEASRRLVLGPEFGCDIEFWKQEGDRLTAPRRNAITESVPVDGESVQVPVATFAAPFGTRDVSRTTVRTRPEFGALTPHDITFPVDVVYTWVDGSDPAWIERRAGVTGSAYHEEAANAARYANHDELRYSLRSLEMYAPWVRTVYLVTDDQTPAWLDTSQPGIEVVSHREMFSDTSVLPTFNSHAIESQLHRIEGLSEQFLYFNDDVFLGAEASPRDFFFANGLTKFFPSPALVPLGPPSADDVPVSVAGKNNRALIEERFGTTPVGKMRHVPHALSRSVLAEIEVEFAEQHRATAAQRFRSSEDIAIPSSLAHYYAFHTRRALPDDIEYAYIDVSLPNAANRLDRLLLNRDKSVFCLNDTLSTEDDFDRSTALLRPFLQTYFPVPGRYELPS